MKAWTLFFLLLLTEGVFAVDIAVIANPSVADHGLSQVRLANLFLVPGATWPDGRSAVPVDLRLPSNIKADFYTAVSGRSVTQIRAYWARQIFTGTGGPPQELLSPSEVIRKVSTTPGAVGYVPKDVLDGDMVKVIAVLNEFGR